jgi:hypothetical protein
MTSSLSPTKSKPFITRYGASKSPELPFPHEERFAWQKAQFVSDVAYKLPDTKMTIGSVFGTSARNGLDDENPDAKKRTTGPGSYNIDRCFDSLSEYATHKASRFGGAAREGMNMKTPSPGAVYDTANVFKHGKDKNIKISFNCDKRRPLHNSSASENADMLWPKLDRGPAITIGKRLKHRSKGDDTPGAVYEVHKKVNFKTGPSFSFGRSKASRFKGTDDPLDLMMNP